MRERRASDGSALGDGGWQDGTGVLFTSRGAATGGGMATDGWGLAPTFGMPPDQSYPRTWTGNPRR